MNPITRVPKRIVFAGDWHGNANFALAATALAHYEHKADVILHTGDFGYDFTPGFLAALNDLLMRQNMALMFVDGNHENFDWLLSQPVDKKTRLRPLAERIWHIPRGTKWTWGGVRFLGLGGAVSIDKLARVPGESWWPQEALTSPQLIKARRVGQVDVMITHDCPTDVFIPGVDDGRPVPVSWRPMLAECHANRAKLAGVVNAVKPWLLVHGHYHVRYSQLVKALAPRSGGGVVHGYKVIGLDCDVRAQDNMQVFDLEELRSDA